MKFLKNLAVFREIDLAIKEIIESHDLFHELYSNLMN